MNNHSPRRRSPVVALVMMAIAVCCAAIPLTAQAQRRSSGKRSEIPEPRVEKLKTKDGVELAALYCPSAKKKDAIPVLLVHEWQGQVSPYTKLINGLQQAECAVLALNYRGHGNSNKYIDRRGEEKKFDLSRMNKRDVESIITFDLESAKAFLKTENNAGQLNLNALVVIGVREGAVLGSIWAARDWSFPSVGRMKQGQDVKALVMISPDKQIRGLPLEPVLKNRQILSLPIMIVEGKASSDAKETLRIARRIKGAKKRFGGGKAENYELTMVDTSLTGASLINQSSSTIPSIVKFITTEVEVSDTMNPWIERD